MNALIWRKQGDLESLAFYNIGNTIMLPLIFYINGLLLKKIRITQLFFIGALLTAIIPITIVFLPTSKSWYYLVFGFLFGIGYGFYWANRNYFTYKETASHNRNYFLGINFSLNTITGILVPMIIGWFIFLTPRFGYQISLIIAFLLLFLAGAKVVNDKHENPEISRITIAKATKKWWAVRVLVISIGVIEGISFFFPTLLILTKIGAENALGSFYSFINIATALLIYFYGRKAGTSHQKPVLWTSVIIGFLAAAIFGLTFNTASTIFYIVVNYLTIAFMWLTSGPITMDIIDAEKKEKGQNTYSLIFDWELFLNLGRLLSFGLLFFIIYIFGQTAAIRFSPILVYTAQIFFILLSLNKIKLIKKTAI